MLKNRYGDGYRASSMGLLIWQDGVFNTLDDISSVRVQNMAFDNFLYAGYEAYASMTLDNDPMQQEYLLRVAEEDFAFAMEKFKKDGFDQFVQPYEHSYNTSKSQYMATISWSASQLYKLTGKPSYADIAAEYIRYTLDCQRTEPLKDKDGTRGFFYRDKSRKSIVHYIHQSREQVYMQAMVMLCETQKEHPDYSVQGLAHIALVEESHQHGGGAVHHLHPRHVQAPADIHAPGLLGQHDLHADRLVQGGPGDGAALPAVLVAPGEVAHQVSGGAEAQPGQGLGPGLPHAGKVGEGRAHIHVPASFRKASRS